MWIGIKERICISGTRGIFFAGPSSLAEGWANLTTRVFYSNRPRLKTLLLLPNQSKPMLPRFGPRNRGRRHFSEPASLARRPKHRRTNADAVEDARVAYRCSGPQTRLAGPCHTYVCPNSYPSMRTSEIAPACASAYVGRSRGVNGSSSTSTFN